MTTDDQIAKSLKIRLFKNGVQKVDLNFPAKTAKWIIELIPKHILIKIEEKGIDIVSVQKKINGEKKLYPQQLLDYQDEQSPEKLQIKVWLE